MVYRELREARRKKSPYMLSISELVVPSYDRQTKYVVYMVCRLQFVLCFPFWLQEFGLYMCMHVCVCVWPSVIYPCGPSTKNFDKPFKTSLNKFPVGEIDFVFMDNLIVRTRMFKKLPALL